MSYFVGTFSVVSGESFTSAIDVGQPATKVLLGIPATVSGTALRVHVAGDLAGTYRPLFHEPTGAVITPAVVSFPSTVCNCVVPIPTLGARFLKVELVSATCVNSYPFTVIAT